MSDEYLRIIAGLDFLISCLLIVSKPEVYMEPDKETLETVQARLDVLRKGIISEENSVNYYKTLIEKTPEDSDANIGMRRMYSGLMLEEKKHVERFRELINEWEQRLKEL
jgi:rubrerythrin